MFTHMYLGEKLFFVSRIKDKFWCFKMTIHRNFYVFLPRSHKLFSFPKNCLRTSDVRIYTRKLFTIFDMFKLVFCIFILGSYRPTRQNTTSNLSSLSSYRNINHAQAQAQAQTWFKNSTKFQNIGNFIGFRHIY
jgi:hypothetical protein